MSIIASGYEWQADSLADAADNADEHYRVNAPGPHTDLVAAYCRGVADGIRLLSGRLIDDQSKWPTPLARIYDEYLSSI